MKTIIIAMLLATSAQACDLCENAEVIRQAFIEEFNEDPENPSDSYELDTYEQCKALENAQIYLKECKGV